MLDLKAKDGGVAFEAFDLAVDIFHIVGKPFAEAYHPSVRPFVRNANAPEEDHASDIE